MVHSIAEDGFSLAPGVIGPDDRDALLLALGPVAGAGRRGLLGVREVGEIARSALMLKLVRPYLPAEPRPVRVIFFDKSDDANWFVPWHQDLTLAVRERREVEGFGPWSVKDGVPHVQPPVELLGRMLTVRLHLDDAGESNGALRVLPGSHLCGRLSPAEIQDWRATTPDVLCRAQAGDILLMRPLLLHASSRSEAGGHRRVLHIEYAGFTLPEPLAWHEAA
jgi:hypothetical protein